MNAFHLVFLTIVSFLIGFNDAVESPSANSMFFFSLFYVVEWFWNLILLLAAIIAKQLREILEDLRIRMPIGVPEMGLPILDPFVLDDPQELDISYPEIGV